MHNLQWQDAPTLGQGGFSWLSLAVHATRPYGGSGCAVLIVDHHKEARQWWDWDGWAGTCLSVESRAHKSSKIVQAVTVFINKLRCLVWRGDCDVVLSPRGKTADCHQTGTTPAITTNILVYWIRYTSIDGLRLQKGFSKILIFVFCSRLYIFNKQV